MSREFFPITVENLQSAFNLIFDIVNCNDGNIFLMQECINKFGVHGLWKTV